MKKRKVDSSCFLAHVSLEKGRLSSGSQEVMYRCESKRKNGTVIMALKERPDTKREERNLNCFVSLELDPALE